MGQDFVNDLVSALKRVFTPDGPRLREVLIVSGMPEDSENLRYLNFNRQVVIEDGRTLTYSAVAVINNRRIPQWRLSGYRKSISQLIFNSRWTRNPLDLFLNSLRCHPELMDALSTAPFRYTLLGILEIEETQGSGLSKRRYRHIRPVVAAPGMTPDAQKSIAAFEAANDIMKTKIRGLPFYHKSR
jgi:hypothetical protein